MGSVYHCSICGIKTDLYNEHRCDEKKLKHIERGYRSVPDVDERDTRTFGGRLHDSERMVTGEDY
jgi:hypothetical protein